MEKVVRFYVPKGGEALRNIENKDMIVPNDTSVEICTLKSLDNGELITIPYERDESGKAVREQAILGWDIDPNKEYYIVAEAWWHNFGHYPYGNIEISEKVRSSPMPKQLVDIMKMKNVVSIGLWDQWGDGETLSDAIDELKRKGYNNLHNYGKYYDENPVGRYAELFEFGSKTINGPRIKLRKKQKQAKTHQPQQPTETKKFGSLVIGHPELLDAAVLSLMKTKYAGKQIEVTQEKGAVKVLIMDKNNNPNSQNE